ncbi:MAG: EAL domain-containing protein [Akkermansiaceae bacterium]|nr:EAL domain-containing protein [Akkermansiaceae bacterium]
MRRKMRIASSRIKSERMQGADGVEIMPDAFLPVAERFNLSARIDSWVVSHLLSLFAREPSWVARIDWCARKRSRSSRRAAASW